MVQIVQRKLMWKKTKNVLQVRDGASRKASWKRPELSKRLKGMLGLDKLGGGTISRE